ncbi:MAG TPA: winged helix DNA-binding protein [Thermoanaerobaculia bacterium]|jgi:DNA-binding MarR family transcriptional regulator|nr:winged helix DNA-binding protein [Thermoanaerobaculia bacterium]
MSLTFLTPESFADLDDAPSQEIGRLVERAAMEADPTTLKVATALLFDRALLLLREGSRQEILDEALAVSRGISYEAGSALRKTNPETFGAWSALDKLLGEAARRSDRAAVPSLLRGTHGPAVLELLAGEGRALPRAVIRKRLDLGEAHLSHLLRDLEEANLIVRYRPEKSKEVFVELGPAGREVVSQSVLPPWLERLEETLQALAAGARIQSETLAQELEANGAPSRLAAQRLAKAIARLSSVKPHPSSGRRSPRKEKIRWLRSLSNL